MLTQGEVCEGQKSSCQPPYTSLPGRGLEENTGSATTSYPLTTSELTQTLHLLPPEVSRVEAVVYHPVLVLKPVPGTLDVPE